MKTPEQKQYISPRLSTFLSFPSFTSPPLYVHNPIARICFCKIHFCMLQLYHFLRSNVLFYLVMMLCVSSGQKKNTQLRSEQDYLLAYKRVLSPQKRGSKLSLCLVEASFFTFKFYYKSLGECLCVKKVV